MKARDILSVLGSRFDAVEVYLEYVKRSGFELENSRDYSKHMYEQHGCGIRVVRDSHPAFVYSTMHGEVGEVEKIAEQLERYIGMSENADIFRIPEIPCRIEDDDTRNVPEEERIKDAIYTMDEIAKGFDKRVKSVKSAYVETFEKELEIVNSHGLEALVKKTAFSVGVSSLAEDRISEVGYYNVDSVDFELFDFEMIARESSQRAVNKLYPAPIQPKKYSLILSSEVMVQLLSHFFRVFNGYSVVDHTTALEEREGTKVFSEMITVVDEPRYPGRPSFVVDDEGVEHGRVIVVDGGILKTFLHNSYTSSKLGVLSTGNARRKTYDSIPRVGPGIFYIEPGEATLRELMGRIDGLYVTEIMGLHMANNVSGDFSLGINGFLVKGGEPVSYFRGASFASNFFDMMNNVIGLSGDMFFSGPYGSCDVAVADCVVGSGG